MSKPTKMKNNIIARLSHIDLISQQNFGSITLPAAVSTCREHILASWVDIELRNDTGAMTRDDQERNSRVLVCLFLQVVQAKNIMRGTRSSVSTVSSKNMYLCKCIMFKLTKEDVVH